MTSLFVASIGNPAPYENTLHSAGHMLLNSLASCLQAPAFANDPSLSNGLTTETRLRNNDQTRVRLWQSPRYMNESGPTLVRAYKKWLERESLAALTPAPHSEEDLLQANSAAAFRLNPQHYRPRLNLVLLHDVLDTVPGKFQVRYGGAERSSRGHHGVISVVDALVKEGFLKNSPPEDFAKLENAALLGKEKSALLGKDLESSRQQKAAEARKQVLGSPVMLRLQIGIGRTGGKDSRAPQDVAEFVMRQMCSSQYNRTCAQANAVASYLESLSSQ